MSGIFIIHPLINIPEYLIMVLTIQFFKDGADNYYVQSNQDATIDLKYRMGTNGSYFNREISDDLTLDDMPEEVKIPITAESEVKENFREFKKVISRLAPSQF